MQSRQLNRRQYFNELATTSEKYFIPYIKRYRQVGKGTKVLEIGCGDGGNLLPFSRMGCDVVGVDMAEGRIRDARKFFQENGAKGRFIASDVFLLKELRHQFDLIVCHDVIEHIDDKEEFMHKCKQLLKTGGGVIFMSFPAWQMPFGGHQQICRSRFLSHLPFFHLLPTRLYERILRARKEDEGCVRELLNIKKTKCPIELFERTMRKEGFEAIDRTFYFINPHYEVKFHLRPRRLYAVIGAIPYIRNFFTTSCFYFLKSAGE